MSHAHHNELPHTTEQHDAPDAWHTHYTDEPAPQHAHGENIQSGQVFVFGAAGFAVLVAVIVAVIVYYNWYATSLQVALVEQAPFATGPEGKGKGSMNDNAEALRKLAPSNDNNQWQTVDRTKGTYQTTLDKAMEKVIKQYEKRETSPKAAPTEK